MFIVESNNVTSATNVNYITRFTLQIPPISHFSNNCGIHEVNFGAVDVVSLVEDKVEIAAGAIFIAE